MIGFVLPEAAEAARGRLRRVQLRALALLVPLGVAATAGAAALAHWAQAPAPALSAGATALVCLFGGAAIVAGLRAGRFPHDRLGLCNVVTMIRAAVIAALAGLAPAAEALRDPAMLGWVVFGLALVAVLLDGVDGWAARRSGLQSAFGARFDMETDVVLAIILGLLAWQTGKVGVWFLALGLMRPAFALAARLLPALRRPLPEARRRKRVAALQMLVQVALLAPVVTAPLAPILGAGALIVVGASFGADVRWLLRQRSPDA